MRIKYLFVTALLSSATPFLNPQSYVASRTGTFSPPNTPQPKTVLFLQNSQGQKPIILFQTNLRVNTDGSPLSYHPQDLLGHDKALNSICNAIVVTRVGSDVNLCRLKKESKVAVGVFEKFRDSNYRQVPDGFTITWANVLATVKDQGRNAPCVFASGPFTGYFGSLTALKNGLTGDKGECDIDDQVNPLAVPALVLLGGKKNVLKDFGAGVGDLLVAYNPKTTRFTSAIIGDTGPKDNLGEGSVFLNMQLLGLTDPPTKKSETFQLSIDNTQVLVAIMPATRSFERARPYTAANIDARVRQWQQEAGFGTPEQFIALLTSFQPRLK